MFVNSKGPQYLIYALIKIDTFSAIHVSETRLVTGADQEPDTPAFHDHFWPQLGPKVAD
jgi:hypothetical protein